MKKHLLLACVCLSIFAVSTFAQPSIGDVQHYYGTISAVNTGFYGGTIYCAVQLNTNELTGQVTRAQCLQNIVVVPITNTYRERILALLLAAQAGNWKVHLRTKYWEVALASGRYSHLEEVTVGDPWVAW